MKLISLNEFMDNIDFYLQEAKNGKTFIYPTDTVYGIGAIPTNQSINKIYWVKNRDNSKPLSIIAPNIEWIKQNFVVKEDFDKFFNDALHTYHGITMLLEKKDPLVLPGIGKMIPEIGNNPIVGVRIIKHPFQQFIDKLGQPFISTSANLSGEHSTFKILQINPTVISQMDYVIDGGELTGKPSVIINGMEVTHRVR